MNPSAFDDAIAFAGAEFAYPAVIQQKIDQNRGKVRVAADLSEKGIAEIKAEERMQGELAEQALQNFEVELVMLHEGEPGAAT